MKTPIQSPQTVAELLMRAEHMAGFTLAELAQSHHVPMPANLQRDKGWVGQLIELELGATAGSKPEQDFRHLGIELKTIPINAQGRPLETTYVCVAPLTNIQGLRWQDSLVCHKLQQVLWVPIAGDRNIPLAERRIGTPFLWQPSPSQWAQLQQDWEEIMELISIGRVNHITARHGEVLQLRPKAANSRVKTASIDSAGQKQLSNPRGFYLKINFTADILRLAFL
ncbi:DNA mismatch repair endonuclease MutH [Shewanella sp. NIFS-20-20]|uniref:DNA mismatch repair endonuclease MutH n=1 Tax=Shewanella sp. NIFS-20-20 TaxID=2853806 RepID=UPI001C47D295|nr:DNA mismatch repair endonuclease MutH [Shewanella sp. NIFS-20-20]MBV7314246.1 DNA mismatch repair endonuclease MutH [Shewanella sp. NIFS-20-20]